MSFIGLDSRYHRCIQLSTFPGVEHRHMQFKLFVATDYKYRGTPVINYHPSFNMKIEGPLQSRLRPGHSNPCGPTRSGTYTTVLADHYTHLFLRPGDAQTIVGQPGQGPYADLADQGPYADQYYHIIGQGRTAPCRPTQPGTPTHYMSLAGHNSFIQ